MSSNLVSWLAESEDAMKRIQECERRIERKMRDVLETGKRRGLAERLGGRPSTEATS